MGGLLRVAPRELAAAQRRSIVVAATIAAAARKIRGGTQAM
jgi:hypothetical protein